MANKRIKKLAITLSLAELKIIVNKCGNDGHSILSPLALEGVNEPFVKMVTKTYTSDGSPKGSIFVKGDVVNALTGVYTLDVLYAASHVAKIDTLRAGMFIGRGFVARALTEEITKFIAMMESAGLVDTERAL